MLKFTCSYDFLIFNKLLRKKNSCENEIQYDANFTLYLDSLPLRIKATPIFYFTTENDVRSYNPLVFSLPTNLITIFFLKDVPPVPNITHAVPMAYSDAHRHA
jgi:hypothetical protein